MVSRIAVCQLVAFEWQAFSLLVLCSFVLVTSPGWIASKVAQASGTEPVSDKSSLAPFTFLFDKCPVPLS